MEMKSISKSTLNNVFLNIVEKVNPCISVDGDNFEHSL